MPSLTFLLQIFIVLLIIGVLIWGFKQIDFIHPLVKVALVVVVSVLMLLWLLNFVGGHSGGRQLFGGDSMRLINKNPGPAEIESWEAKVGTTPIVMAVDEVAFSTQDFKDLLKLPEGELRAYLSRFQMRDYDRDA